MGLILYGIFELWVLLTYGLTNWDQEKEIIFSPDIIHYPETVANDGTYWKSYCNWSKQKICKILLEKCNRLKIINLNGNL